VLLLGCPHLGATDKKKLKPKEGAVLLLNNGDTHIWITSIDGANAGVKPQGLYELTPGSHTLRAQLYSVKNRATWTSNTYVDYPFEAKAGMVLNLVCEEKIESYGGQGKGTWRLWVEEVASGKDIHEVMQATVLAAQEQEHEQQLARNFGEMKAKAEQGDLESQYELGLLYQRGEGVAANPGEAMAWCQAT
jgi:TPR repeat protein